MRVAMVQIDGKMPNLALMKIAGWHRLRGDTVVRGLDGSVDKAYISVIWPQNKPRALSASKMFTCPVEIGGSGYDYMVTLPDEIEHTMPAYDLWGVDYSMGFTSRGCSRRCPWCIVGDKEGNKTVPHADLSEFLHPSHNKVILHDGNLLASPTASEVLRDLRESGVKVSFNQGLDIRLVNDEVAALLADQNYYNWHFTGHQLYFAYDTMAVGKAAHRGIEMLVEAGIPPKHLMFYMLVGFDTTFKQDMERYQTLWEELGVYPFVMIYNRQGTPTLRAFARWVNKRVHKVCSWIDYEHGAKKAGIMEVPKC